MKKLYQSNKEKKSKVLNWLARRGIFDEILRPSLPFLPLQADSIFFNKHIWVLVPSYLNFRGSVQAAVKGICVVELFDYNDPRWIIFRISFLCHKLI